MAEWQNGSVRMGEWQNGRVAEWQSGRVAEWQNGRAVEWRSGRMAEGAGKNVDIYQADREPKVSEKVEFHNLAVPRKKKSGRKKRG